jgi:hypothetical protein
MGKPEIEAFLSHLVMACNVASSKQNQAFNAILYTHVLNRGGKGVRSPLDFAPRKPDTRIYIQSLN